MLAMSPEQHESASPRMIAFKKFMFNIEHLAAEGATKLPEDFEVLSLQDAPGNVGEHKGFPVPPPVLRNRSHLIKMLQELVFRDSDPGISGVGLGPAGTPRADLFARRSSSPIASLPRSAFFQAPPDEPMRMHRMMIQAAVGSAVGLRLPPPMPPPFEAPPGPSTSDGYAEGDVSPPPPAATSSSARLSSHAGFSSRQVPASAAFHFAASGRPPSDASSVPWWTAHGRSGALESAATSATGSDAFAHGRRHHPSQFPPWGLNKLPSTSSGIDASAPLQLLHSDDKGRSFSEQRSFEASMFGVVPSLLPISPDPFMSSADPSSRGVSPSSHFYSETAIPTNIREEESLFSSSSFCAGSGPATDAASFSDDDGLFADLLEDRHSRPR
jgi:hypothetical protein